MTHQNRNSISLSFFCNISLEILFGRIFFFQHCNSPNIKFYKSMIHLFYLPNFQPLRLFFLSNVLGPMFIQGPTFILFARFSRPYVYSLFYIYSDVRNHVKLGVFSKDTLLWKNTSSKSREKKLVQNSRNLALFFKVNCAWSLYALFSAFLSIRVIFAQTHQWFF